MMRRWSKKIFFFKNELITLKSKLDISQKQKTLFKKKRKQETDNLLKQKNVI